jgi:excisionase family DNA binding protein
VDNDKHTRTTEASEMGNALRDIRDEVGNREHMRPQLMTIPESAAALRVSRSYLYEMIAAGEFRPVRLGRLVRLDARDIESWIEDQKSA